MVLVIALTLGGVWLTVLVARWNRLFFDALQERNYAAFVSLLGRFGVLAALYIATAVHALYCTQMLQIRWRRWLTERYSRDWLAGAPTTCSSSSHRAWRIPNSPSRMTSVSSPA